MEAIRLRWLCCVFPPLSGRDAQLFQMQGLCSLKSQGGGAESLSVSARPLGCLSAVPTRSCLQQTISSVTVSGLPAVPVLGCLPLPTANRMLLLDQFSGFHSCSGSRLEGICVCVCVLFSSSFFFLALLVFLLLLFNLHIPNLSCWTTPPSNSCQTPLQGDSQSLQETNNVQRNFKVYSEKRASSKAVSRSPWSSLL